MNLVEQQLKKTKITTDQFTGYKPLEKEICKNKSEKVRKKEDNLPELHRVIMNFKGWLKGLHHYVGDLLDYINEYTYRFYRRFMKRNIFDNLMNRMTKTIQHAYKMIIG